MRIFLIGFMGTGKSATGKRLAKILNLQWFDTDNFIECRYNQSVTQIIEQKGEKEFRDIETKTINEISEYENVIISCGGGLPCFNQNMQKMNEQGITIYLKSTETQLFERLKKTKIERILLKNFSENELKHYISDNLQEREKFYNQAKIIIETETNFTHISSIVQKIDDFNIK
jgi:shikimate kinase